MSSRAERLVIARPEMRQFDFALYLELKPTPSGLVSEGNVKEDEDFNRRDALKYLKIKIRI